MVQNVPHRTPFDQITIDVVPYRPLLIGLKPYFVLPTYQSGLSSLVPVENVPDLIWGMEILECTWNFMLKSPDNLTHFRNIVSIVSVESLDSLESCANIMSLRNLIRKFQIS